MHILYATILCHHLVLSFLLFSSEALWSARLTQRSHPLLLYCNNSLIVISSPWLFMGSCCDFFCSCAKIYQHLWYSHCIIIYVYITDSIYGIIMHCCTIGALMSPRNFSLLLPLTGPIIYMHSTCSIAGSILLHWRGHTSSFFFGSWGRRTYIKY